MNKFVIFFSIVFRQIQHNSHIITFLLDKISLNPRRNGYKVVNAINKTKDVTNVKNFL